MQPLNLPPASAVPPRSIVIALNPDERSSVRDGVLVLGLSALALGAVGGYLIGHARSNKRNNPSGISRYIWWLP